MNDDEYDDIVSAALPAPKKPRPQVDYQSLYQQVGQKYGVDPDLLYRQAKHESVNFNPHYVFGPGRSPKGAAGLAQFMPQTARQYGLYVGKGRDDRFDPVKSADAHGRLMKDLIDRYKDPQLALSAYNSGTNRTPQSARRAMERIPETRNYVQKLAPTQDDGYDDIVSAAIPKTAAKPTPTPQTDSYDDVIAAAAQKRANPFARIRAGVKGQRGLGQPAQGMGELAQMGEREVQRQQRIRKQVEADQGLGADFLPSRPQARGPVATNEEVLRRVAGERGQEEEQQRLQAEHQRLVASFTPEEIKQTQDIAAQLKRHGPGVRRGIDRAVQTATSGVLYKLAGLADIGNEVAKRTVGESWLPDALRRKALAGELAVQDLQDLPQPTREKIADFLTSSAAGLLEVIAAPGGPVTKFAGLAGTEALGRGRSLPEVAKETVKGATVGALFKGAGEAFAPEATATREARVLAGAKQAGTVGAGTAGLELATGTTPQQAGVAALTNALYAGVPTALSARGVQPEAKTETPQRFQHLQFGEVEVLADQSGARPGKIRVAEVADPTKQHFVRKSDMQGRGNARMIPVRPAVEPTEQARKVSPEPLPEEGALQEQPTPSPTVEERGQAPLPSDAMLGKVRSPVAPQDRATYQGKRFWIGTVNMLDGQIENVYTRGEAEAGGAKHEAYMRPADVEGINSGERGMFWIDSRGQVQSEWRNKPIPPELKAQVEQQIQREGQVPTKPAMEGEPSAVEKAVATKASRPTISPSEGAVGSEKIAAPSITTPGRQGELGQLKISREKVEYQPATTPILKEVERTTQGGDAQRPSLRQYTRRAKSYVQRSLIAEFTPLRELEQTLYGKESIPTVNMARKFEQVAGAPAKAQADILDFRKNVVDPVRKSADDFNSYLFLKRVEDRLIKEPERKRVSTWTVEKARNGLNELKAKVGPETYEQLERQGKVYQMEMDKALHLQVESGRMSQELYNSIKESNDFYAPFKVLRYIEDADLFRGTGRRVATTQDLSRKITGIDSEDFKLGNILQASAEQIVRSRILAEKNLKMLELDKLADRDPDGLLIKRITQEKSRPQHGYEFVRFFKGGKEQILEVDHTIANAVQGLNPKQASLIAQTMAMAKKPLQIGATSANAGFQAVNLFFADLPRAALVSRYGVRSVKDVYQFPMDWAYSLFTSMKGNFGKPNKLYMDWLRSGAANSTIQRELTPEAFRPTLGIAKPGIKHLGKSVLNSVAQFSNAIEETSKVLGLKRGMRAEQIAKMSPVERQQAMEKIAAEVRNYSGSPDFARKGSETRDLNLLFMFFNARLQGVTADISRLAGQTGTKEGATAWARLATTIALPSALLAVVNNLPGNKEDYDKIPDWEKKNYWMIPRNSYFTNEDTGETVRDYWRIPKRELGQLIGNTTESAVQFGMTREPTIGKAWAIDMIENMSPVNIQGRTLGERAESVFSSTNPALKLPAETLMNRDTFRHRNIVPEYMKKAAPEEQYRESTPRGYVAVGKALKVSPLQLEHAAEGLTGSAASQFSIREQQPGRSRLGRFPLTKRFVRSGQTAVDESQTQEQTDFATKQLQRRRARQEAVKKYRAGEISKADLDKLEEEDTLTESDIKRIEKESGLSLTQQRFSVTPPNVALDRYERMDTAQRADVEDLMEKKAYSLLNSTALTDAQKEAFQERIDKLGITPRSSRARGPGGFKNTFKQGFKNQFANPF